jgi:GR25 family glycosyltransferase involved in LPS biosynthesis
MKAYIIVLEGNRISEKGLRDCLLSNERNSNDIDIEVFPAITPDKVDGLLEEYQLKYTYPTSAPKMDFNSGLQLSPYETGKLKNRIACFFSHYLLWKKCVATHTDFMILEHDAEFIDKVRTDHLQKSKYQIIGINDPRGATRRAQQYHQLVQSNGNTIAPPPTIDAPQVPQGLAGNSAYYIKQTGAKKLIDLVDQHGIWPNDAIMCKQLLPGMLGQTKKYYSRVQGLVSTTTL